MVVFLAIGILLTAVSIFYSRMTTGQYCSPDPAVNSRVDCSLKVDNRGLPFAYLINPNYQPKHGLQPFGLLGDVLIWAVVGGCILVAIRRVKR